LSVADADTYATENFMGADLTAWNAATTANKEASLRQATQYIDSRFRDRFVGYIRSQSQALEWPRSNAYDRSGRLLTGTPDAVKAATTELAKERILAGTSLVPSEARGGAVKREKVDVIEVEYMDNAPAGTTYRFVSDLLSLVLKQSSRRVVRV
jgi:hypothetical protein